MLRLCSCRRAAAVAAVFVTAGAPASRPAIRRQRPLAVPLNTAPLATSCRHRSTVAAFFGFHPYRRKGSRTAEEAEAEERRRYNTLGDYLDRMPPPLRALLVWSPALLLLYFCCKQQRCYYLADDEWFFYLFFPKAVRTRLRGDDGGGHLRTLLTMPREKAVEGDGGEVAGKDAAGWKPTRARYLPFSSSLNVIAEIKKQPNGSIITRLKQLTYMADIVVCHVRAKAALPNNRPSWPRMHARPTSSGRTCPPPDGSRAFRACFAARKQITLPPPRTRRRCSRRRSSLSPPSG